MKLRTLTLYTPELTPQQHFYGELLGLPTDRAADDLLRVQAGATELVFRLSAAPFYYHFAFNIPPYQYDAALSWLKARLPLLTDNGTELIDFSNWNAYAMYFEDAGGNILEFIARRDLEIAPVAPFGPAGIHSVSEIGLSVQDVGRTFDQIHQVTGLPFYSGNRSNFCAAGNPEGLFIIVDHANKDWYPTDRPARLAPVEAVFEESGRRWRLGLDEEGGVKPQNVNPW